MRLRTVVKLGTIISVLLFVVAVGYYAFMQLDMADRNRDINLYSLVPADCTAVLESDDISAFLHECSNLNYASELERLQFPGLFNFIIGGLTEYTTENAHGLSSQMNRLLVSFHAPCGPHDQVIYFQTGTADETLLDDMLQEYMPDRFLPKEEIYRGEKIVVYPLNHEEYLSVYAQSGFLAVSYQKMLIEKVIDANLDDESLKDDAVFSQVLKGKKNQFLTLYTYGPVMPMMQQEEAAGWSEFDFHLNSDVLYLAGDNYLSSEVELADLVSDNLRETPFVRQEGLLISADRDSTQWYMNKAYEENVLNKQSFFNECVASLSYEACFSLVADMQCLDSDSQLLRPYLPAFIWNNAPLFSSFVLSAQYSLVNGKLSHIWTFTYKH